MDITELLAFAVKNKASDLHLSAGLPPMIRVHGDIRRINLPPMEHEDVHAMVYDIMSDAQRKMYEEMLECDFSFGIPNLARFRVNAYNQQRGAAVAFRTIPSKVLTLEELNCPKSFAPMTERPRGLILVTGPTGSGKSTTLAAMVNHVNENEYGHILTIEDPIEFLHDSKKCLINQREVGPHTLSFANALRAALAESLVAVISQSLLKTKDGQGRTAAWEIMIGTAAIRNLIRENKVAQMYSVIQTSQAAGMQTMDQCLTEMVRRNQVQLAEARARAINKDLFGG